MINEETIARFGGKVKGLVDLEELVKRFSTSRPEVTITTNPWIVIPNEAYRDGPRKVISITELATGGTLDLNDETVEYCLGGFSGRGFGWPDRRTVNELGEIIGPVYEALHAQFGDERLVFRSSAEHEDGSEESSTGVLTSVATTLYSPMDLANFLLTLVNINKVQLPKTQRLNFVVGPEIAGTHTIANVYTTSNFTNVTEVLLASYNGAETLSTYNGGLQIGVPPDELDDFLGQDRWYPEPAEYWGAFTPGKKAFALSQKRWALPGYQRLLIDKETGEKTLVDSSLFDAQVGLRNIMKDLDRIVMMGDTDDVADGVLSHIYNASPKHKLGQEVDDTFAEVAVGLSTGEIALSQAYTIVLDLFDKVGETWETYVTMVYEEPTTSIDAVLQFEGEVTRYDKRQIPESVRFVYQYIDACGTIPSFSVTERQTFVAQVEHLNAKQREEWERKEAERQERIKAGTATEWDFPDEIFEYDIEHDISVPSADAIVDRWFDPGQREALIAGEEELPITPGERERKDGLFDDIFSKRPYNRLRDFIELSLRIKAFYHSLIKGAQQARYIEENPQLDEVIAFSAYVDQEQGPRDLEIALHEGGIVPVQCRPIVKDAVINRVDSEKSARRTSMEVERITYTNVDVNPEEITLLDTDEYVPIVFARTVTQAYDITFSLQFETVDDTDFCSAQKSRSVYLFSSKGGFVQKRQWKQYEKTLREPGHVGIGNLGLSESSVTNHGSASTSYCGGTPLFVSGSINTIIERLGQDHPDLELRIVSDGKFGGLYVHKNDLSKVKETFGYTTASA